MSAFKKISDDHFDLIITELKLPRMDGIELLKQTREVKPATPVILVTENAGITEAVEAMKLGALDFIIKPLTPQMLRIISGQIMMTSPGKNANGHSGKSQGHAKYDIITQDFEMKRILATIGDVADSQASIFIQGESGTGKELFARYIHQCSRRRTKPFVAINCAALPETLLESELFGHEKGAFTGAISQKKGKFEIAHQGTLLLDEISEMDLGLQSKLLRVLQEREIDRVGGNNPIPVDVRIIATTNRDIEKQIHDGKFREDLYYRLNVLPIYLPPLRERKGDIALLSDYFIKKYNQIDDRNVKGLTGEALQVLLEMPWKGNVRELENITERAVLLCKNDYLSEDDLHPQGRCSQVQGTGYAFTPSIAPVTLREVEKKTIFHALDRTKGNRTHAAEILGISVRTLRNKSNEYRNKMEAQ